MGCEGNWAGQKWSSGRHLGGGQELKDKWSHVVEHGMNM